MDCDADALSEAMAAAVDAYRVAHPDVMVSAVIDACDQIKGKLAQYGVKQHLEIRKHACLCAATALAAYADSDQPMRHAWSLTVFFESYMIEGAEGTEKDFGPKDAVKLATVKDNAQ